MIEVRYNYTTGTGQKMRVHHINECTARPCVIHSPSDHSMIKFPTHWRADRGIMERICPHGVGHPDPDDDAYRVSQGEDPEYSSIHGCDRCCA